MRPNRLLLVRLAAHGTHLSWYDGEGPREGHVDQTDPDEEHGLAAVCRQVQCGESAHQETSYSQHGHLKNHRHLFASDSLLVKLEVREIINKLVLISIVRLLLSSRRDPSFRQCTQSMTVFGAVSKSALAAGHNFSLSVLTS